MTYPFWKIWVRQLGWLFHILWKIKNVPNHQAVMIVAYYWWKQCEILWDPFHDLVLSWSIKIIVVKPTINGYLAGILYVKRLNSYHFRNLICCWSIFLYISNLSIVLVYHVHSQLDERKMCTTPRKCTRKTMVPGKSPLKPTK